MEIDDLAGVAAIDDLALSADGETVAYCVTTLDLDADRTRTEWRLASAAGDPLSGSAAGRAPRFAPAGGAIAYVEDAGEEGALLCLWADGERRPLAPFAALPGAPAFSPDGSRIAIAAGLAPGAGTRIAIVAVEGGGVEWVEGAEGEDDFAPAFSPDGRLLAFARAVREPGREGPTSAIRVARIGDLAGIPSLPIETGLAYATCPSWSPDGPTLACFGTREVRLGLEDPAQQPWLVPAAGGEARLAVAGVKGAILRPPEGPAWSGDGARIYFKEAHEGDIRLVEATLGEPGALRGLTAAGQVAALATSAGAGRLAIAISTPADPGSVFLHRDGEDREPQPVHRNESAPAAVPALEHRVFTTPDGGRIDGWVQGAAEGESRPLAVCMHGGPHSFVGTGFPLGHFHRHVLAARGWAVLTLNPSGSGSYGAEFADSIRGRWGERDLPQYLAAVDELVADGIADPKRLAVVGYSYGGYLAAWAVAHTDRFRAAVVGAPIANLESFRRTSDIGAWYTPWEMAGTEADTEAEIGALLERLSPVTHAGRVSTPTLILHGEADRRCPIGQAEELRERIAATGRAPVELIRYPDADHLFYSRGRPGQRLDYNRRIVEWLERHVPVGQG